MINRYENNADVPQPGRNILPSVSDYFHVLKANERLDHLAYKYYNDSMLSWIIMCANPEFDNEFEIPAGTELRIPFPLQRVLDAWNIDNEL
jgi:hypothetical protein